MRLLLVEDEPEMAEALRAALRRHNINVDTAETLELAREALANGVHDVVLIDRQMPDGDGLSLVPMLRASPRQVPAIIISALGKTHQRIDGLNIGADDYLPKPFEVDELLARIHAVLRRSPEIVVDTMCIGALAYDTSAREVRVSGQKIDLTRRELLILETLLRRPGRTVVKAALEDAVYGFDDEIQSNSLEANVSRLRRKLADAGAGAEIHNVRGVGYFIREVEE
ncbi:response regulator transcription factor [Paracoccus aestuariivivens]|uniref:Response regulator n=1 Tax=Paracoccus aestuariivivens TaxID=1820333 RepID=A0A6L6JCE6_9RHOB|nr:response regulator transcription factor [Paracoccus aestuariivivens]MTH79166.1 response regulator [Paracoccus aestuariivivens]